MGKRGNGMSGVIPEEGGTKAVEGDLARLGLRTSLMTLDLLLSAVPSNPPGYADAAAEARILSRRIDVAAGDFLDVMRKAG